MEKRLMSIFEAGTLVCLISSLLCMIFTALGLDIIGWVMIGICCGALCTMGICLIIKVWKY